MQDVDSEAWLHGVNLFFDDEDLADLPFLLSDDEAPDSTNQNPENLIAEPSGSDVPSSGLLEGPEPSHNQYESCLETLLEIFPDISLEYVRELYNTWMQGPQSGSDMNQVLRAFEDITLQLLDTKSIPKEKDRTNELKRKRSPALDRHEDMSQRDSGRKEQKNARYIHAASWELQTVFVYLPANIINRAIQEEGSCYAAYLALAKDEMAFENVGKSPLPRLKYPRKVRSHLTYDSGPDSVGYNQREIQRELQAAREHITKIQAKRKAEADAVEAEAALEKLQRDNGDVFECQCCYDEFAMNKITHCDGDTTHYFCLGCAKRNADNEIGNMRYKLICMSGDVCAASFSGNEKRRFLDEKALLVLDRIELQAALKEAGVEIAWCPFCDFGASCPAVYIDKELRCQGTDCGKVSCRICKNESHIPFTCEEWKNKTQTNAQHILEEARTAALLKKCPKCNVPVIKEHGCNRLPCPCGGIMCDYCGKDITGIGYSHFERKDGTTGDNKKCPTFDDFDARRRNAVKTAEADALKEALARNPDLNLDALMTKFQDDPPSGPENPAKNHGRREARAEIAQMRAILAREREVAARIHPLPPVAQVRQPVRVDHQIGTLADYQRFLQRPAQAPVAPAVSLPQHHQPHQTYRSVVAPPQHHQTRQTYRSVVAPLQHHQTHQTYGFVVAPPQHHQTHQTYRSVVPPQHHQTHETHRSVVPPPQPYQPRQTHQFAAPPAAIQPARPAANPAYFHSPHLAAYEAMAFQQAAQFGTDPPYHHPSQVNAYGPVLASDPNPQPAPRSNIRRNY